MKRQGTYEKKTGGKRQPDPGQGSLSMDLKKIFLTPPRSVRERITLLAVMIAVFLLCFGPLCFSAIPPVKAIFLSCAPALSVSWGWMVFLRSLFQKGEFAKEGPKAS